MKKRWISIILIASLVLSCFLYTSADEIDDLQAEAEYNQQQLDELNASIDSLEAEKNELLGRIDETDQELVLTLASISTLNNQIELKTQELSETTRDLGAAEEEEAIEYAAMKKRIQYIYESGGNVGWAASLLNDSDLSDYLNRAEYTQKIYEYDRECLNQYQRTVEQVSQLKSEQEQEKNDLELMLKNQEEQQAYLEEQLVVLKKESDDYDEQLAYATDMASQYVDLINEQNTAIQELVAEQERQRAAAEAAARQAAEEAAAQQAAAEAQRAAAEAQAQADAAEAARQAAEEAQRAAEEAQRAAEEAQNEEAQRAAEEAARQAAEEAQRAAEEAARQEAEQQQQEAEQEQYEEPAVPEDEGGVDEQPYYAETGNAIVDRALAWVGRAQYVFGACSPGVFDCSGFVSYCVTGQYARIGKAATFYSWPQVSDPQPGDIVATPTHCGIYLGDGMICHATDPTLGVIVSEVMPGMVFVRY